MILPTLAYGSEIWGFGDLTAAVEKVHTDSLKRILITCIKKSTQHEMVYGELGRFLVLLHIKKSIINFWLNMLLGKRSKLSYPLYCFIFKLHYWQI